MAELGWLLFYRKRLDTFWNSSLKYSKKCVQSYLSRHILSFQSAVGFELWSMSQDILFDNIIITDDLSVAHQWAADSFDLKRKKIARDSVSVMKYNDKYNFYKVLLIVKSTF